jgi:regulator of G-protein signaling
MENQEKAFWRLKRPPPDMRGINDCLLTKFGTYRHGDNIVQAEPLNAALKADITLLNEMLNMKRFKLSTSLDGIISNCKRYADFDPMLDSPNPPNPWISNDDALWMLERSLVEYPTVRQLKLWACSLHDLLSSVTGRYKFEQFCKKQYCVENVKFWQACCDLKLLPLVSIPGSVKLVYE